MIIWVIKIVLYVSVFSCHLFSLSSASVRSLPFMVFIFSACMKSCLDIANFLEEIASLSHSIVFLYFFALITEEGFLIFPCYFLEFCIHWVYLAFSPLPFASLLLTAICDVSSDNHFAFWHFSFLGMVLITTLYTLSWTSIHSSLGTLIRSNPLTLFVTSPYNRKGFDLGHTWIV